MKKLIVFSAVATLMVSSLAGPADAQKKKKKPKAPQKIEREVEFTYVCPCVGLFQFGTATDGNPNLGGGPVQPAAGELFLTAEATDTTGQPVPVNINQDTDGDGFNDPVGSFCGKTAAPISISEGLEIRVFVGHPQTCATPAVLAGGTITFTLSNLP